LPTKFTTICGANWTAIKTAYQSTIETAIETANKSTDSSTYSTANRSTVSTAFKAAYFAAF
jgi:hypothetical protein